MKVIITLEADNGHALGVNYPVVGEQVEEAVQAAVDNLLINVNTTAGQMHLGLIPEEPLGDRD